jgi:hypothetical protein
MGNAGDASAQSTSHAAVVRIKNDAGTSKNLIGSQRQNRAACAGAGILAARTLSPAVLSSASETGSLVARARHIFGVAAAI